MDYLEDIETVIFQCPDFFLVDKFYKIVFFLCHFFKTRFNVIQILNTTYLPLHLANYF